MDYPDRPLDRLTTGFRIFVAIPILIVLGTVSGGGSWESSYDTTRTTTVAAGGLLFFGPLLMILFRQKYPRWWFDWNLELQRFGSRVGVYLALMDDRYPSTDEHQSVHLDYPYPDAQRDLNRWLPLVKWLLASPHQFVLFFLWIAAPVVVVIQPGHRDGSLTATACRSSHFTVPPAVLALVLLGAGVIPAHLLNLVGARSSEPWGADCFQAGRRPWGPSVTI